MEHCLFFSNNSLKNKKQEMGIKGVSYIYELRIYWIHLTKIKTNVTREKQEVTTILG